jgi:heme A synthase
MKGSGPLAVLFLVLAVLFAAAAVFYFTVKTSLLASSTALHYKHGIIFAALAVLALIAANVARPKAATLR